LQDPLSALDAHVGKAVFQNVFQKPGKTRILVTHALHFLPQVDYIYTIADGRIAERGTYRELMSNNGEFSRFYLTEFGSKESEEGEESKAGGQGIVEKKNDSEKRKNTTAGAELMQAEERKTGAVSWGVYKAYSIDGKGNIVLPLLVFTIVLIQGATVMSQYWYVLSIALSLLRQLDIHLFKGWFIGKKSMFSTA
jgi:ABC-type Fe3+/spermidine/putrescine transport system ATPase subunit